MFHIHFIVYQIRETLTTHIFLNSRHISLQLHVCPVWNTLLLCALLGDTSRHQVFLYILYVLFIHRFFNVFFCSNNITDLHNMYKEQVFTAIYSKFILFFSVFLLMQWCILLLIFCVHVGDVWIVLLGCLDAYTDIHYT